MLNILLKNGPCDGERVPKVSEYSRFHWRWPGGRHERYRHSGQVDAATGCVIFVYAPRRSRA
jgi:hypothetical protein